MSSEPKPNRPILRGWSHALAAIGAIIVTILLLHATAGKPIHWIAMLVFGISMILLYAVSATYHIVTWGPRMYRVLKSFDHANIFVLIAGTYTPFCLVLLDGVLRIVLLALIWGLALIGIALQIGWSTIPRGVSVGFYIGLGWVGIIAAPKLSSILPLGGLLLILGGGILYTLGGVIYALKRPNPFPKIFGFHEIFHLLGIAAHVAFLIAVWAWVVPYAHA